MYKTLFQILDVFIHNKKDDFNWQLYIIKKTEIF